jgi:integrase
MSSIKFSANHVAGLTPRPAAYIDYDPDLPGFGVRIAPRGTRSWIVEFRPNGGGRKQPTQRMTIGHESSLSLAKAREKARTILAEVRLGGDPARERKDRREAVTVAELADLFMTEEVRPLKKPSTAALYDRYFRVHVKPALGTRKARDITRSDIARLHRKIGEIGKPTANRVVVLISGMFTWAAKAGTVPEGPNPARGVSRFKEEGRERFLSADELARLGDALREAETVGLPWDTDEALPAPKHLAKPENRRTIVSPFATAAIRLLLFTGCRLREILHLRWDAVDFDRGVLALPDSKTGKKLVMLAAPALAVLSALPRLGSRVIPGTDPDRPRHDLHKPWRAVAKRAGLIGLRIHDLRHSFASVGVASNLGLPILGKLLGHRAVETTAKYAHVANDPLRRAADTIAEAIAVGLGEKRGAGAEVVPFAVTPKR